MVTYESKNCKGYYELCGVSDPKGIVGVIKLSGKQGHNTFDGLFTPFLYVKTSNEFYCDTRQLWFLGKKELLQDQYIHCIPKDLENEIGAVSNTPISQLSIPLEKLRFGKNQLETVKLIGALFYNKFSDISKLVIKVSKKDNSVEGNRHSKYEKAVSRVFSGTPREFFNKAIMSEEYYALKNGREDTLATPAKLAPKLHKSSKPIPSWSYGITL